MIETTDSKAMYLITQRANPEVFAYPYAFYGAEDIVVAVGSGVEGVTLTGGTEFDVYGTDFASGGTVCLHYGVGNLPALSEMIGKSVTICREVPEKQLTTLPTHGVLPSGELEKALDKIVCITQQLSEIASRSVKLPLGATLDPSAYITYVLNQVAQAAQSAVTAIAAAGTATNAATSAAAYAEEAKHVSGITEHNADGTAHAGGFSHAVAVQGNTHLAQSAFPLYEPGTDITVAPSGDVYYSVACAQLANSKKLVDFGGKRQADGTTMAYISVGRSDGAGENAVFFYITSAGVKGISGEWYLADFSCATPGGTSSSYSIANKEYVDNAATALGGSITALGGSITALGESITALGGSITNLVHELRGEDVTETVITGGTFALNTEYGYESATEVSASFDFPSGYGALAIMVAAPDEDDQYTDWFYANLCYSYAGSHGAVLCCVVPALYHFKFIGSGSGVSITGRTVTVTKLQAKA